jgi:hypothetical protein
MTHHIAIKQEEGLNTKVERVMDVELCGVLEHPCRRMGPKKIQRGEGGRRSAGGLVAGCRRSRLLLCLPGRWSPDLGRLYRGQNVCRQRV